MANYTDLLTFEDLKRDALSSVSDITEIKSEVEYAIADVTARIESYLGRKLIVRQHTLFHHDIHIDLDLDVSTDSTSYWSWYANEWPLLEVDSVTPSSFTVEVHPDSRRFYSDLDSDDSRMREIDYFAGYKRPGQSLSDLQSESGLSGLTTEPDDLPRDIRQVATRLVIHYITDAKKGTIGGRVRDYSIGDRNGVRIEGSSPNFERRELRRISKYRRRV